MYKRERERGKISGDRKKEQYKKVRYQEERYNKNKTEDTSKKGKNRDEKEA